jgi:hypothetical protein
MAGRTPDAGDKGHCYARKGEYEESLGQGAAGFTALCSRSAQLSFNCHNYPSSLTSDFPIHSIPLCWSDQVLHK